MRNVFDISQTWGSDFKVFSWNFNEKDKENLLEHWAEKVTDFPMFEEIDSLDYKLERALVHV